MKISELITKLKEAQEKYGDIESRTFEMTDYSGGEFLPIVQVEYCKADDYDPADWLRHCCRLCAVHVARVKKEKKTNESNHDSSNKC